MYNVIIIHTRHEGHVHQFYTILEALSSNTRALQLDLKRIHIYIVQDVFGSSYSTRGHTVA